MWISTEVADAVVYQLVAARGVITDLSWLGSGEISDKDIVLVTVKQEGRDGGRITITASGSQGYPMSVSPATDSVLLNYGETGRFYFTVKNLGTGSVESGNLKFTLTNDQGEVTDEKTLGFTLKPQTGEKTVLTVNLHDKDGYKQSGILVTVNYGVNSKSAVSSGGYATFDLDTYTGGVSIATQETEDYRAASATTTVNAGQNSVFLQLEKKSQPTSLWDLMVEWVKTNVVAATIMGILALSSVALVIFFRRKNA